MLRDRFLAIGGFDTRFRRAEDVEFAYRLAEAGFHFIFDEDAIGYHYAERPFGSWLQNAREYGVNDVVFAREHGWAEVLERTGHEFRGRHPLVRWMTRTCLGRPRVEHLVQRQLRGISSLSDALHAGVLTRFALSGIYNISYYQGMADQLGVREFRKIIDRPADGSTRA